MIVLLVLLKLAQMPETFKNAALGQPFRTVCDSRSNSHHLVNDLDDCLSRLFWVARLDISQIMNFCAKMPGNALSAPVIVLDVLSC